MMMIRDGSPMPIQTMTSGMYASAGIDDRVQHVAGIAEPAGDRTEHERERRADAKADDDALQACERVDEQVAARDLVAKRLQDTGRRRDERGIRTGSQRHVPVEGHDCAKRERADDDRRLA